jgi:hypothetical protein
LKIAAERSNPASESPKPPQSTDLLQMYEQDMTTAQAQHRDEWVLQKAQRIINDNPGFIYIFSNGDLYDKENPYAVEVRKQGFIPSQHCHVDQRRDPVVHYDSGCS